MADDAKADGRANVLTWLGIIVALGGPTLAVFAKRAGYFGHDAVDGDILNWLAMWGAALLAMLILVVGERQPLAAIGLGRLKPSSILFGLLFGVVVILLFPAANAILKALQIPTPQSTLATVMTLPLWLRVGTWITAGVTEEILFRGYPISRLKAATGSTAIAAAIPFIVFVALHAPTWGLAHLLFVSLAAVVFTISFLWRRDLWTNIIAHLVVDSIPLIILPLTGMPPGQ